MFRLIVLAVSSLMFDGVQAYRNYKSDEENERAISALIYIIVGCCCLASGMVSTVLMGIGGGSIIAVLTTKNRPSEDKKGGQTFIPANPETSTGSRTVAGKDKVETANSSYEFTL
ncbi:hypothetical protein M3Y98_00686400 [Aphelenchoides besseyi]|nr:hypothetical protein M3Y98_00686400 [Aphelenchoides besseyi]KAI6209035.1 hypothetical protein M3Y96_00178500 [Aphelenchoides besseyi]